MEQETKGRPQRRRRGARGQSSEGRASARIKDYRKLRNPFPPMSVFSDDEVAKIHESAFEILENLGIKMLLPEARAIFAKAGAKVDEDNEMVFIGRDIVQAAMATAPKSFEVRGGARERDVLMELGTLTFQSGGGAPHATDLERGRRTGTGQDFRELVQITQHFDALHFIGPVVEPQDIPTHLRHYFTMEAQLTLSDKVPFVFSRGTPQVLECFEMIRDFRGLTDEAFKANPHCFTVINTNSPRVLDIPMLQGLIDFARHGQMAIVTPFTLMGAMAPITVAGAITLSHAEAMAAITLTQLVNPGAPVLYGTFTSNVDMKSGAPAFGTPEHFKASLGAGQMARHLGLPWRCAGGSAANINDAQAANENQFALWGCLMAGASTIIHSAGWLEGGLSVSYEKLITDMEVLQMVAEMCTPTPAGDAEIALDAHQEVGPAGHFFGCAHTMERYETQFYEPLVGDWSNYGAWVERGELTASQRATGIWKKILADNVRPTMDDTRVAQLNSYINKRTADGGAPPES